MAKSLHGGGKRFLAESARARWLRRAPCLLAAIAVALATGPALPKVEPANAASTRYLDPVFDGALAPVTEFSYDPAIPLNQQQRLTVKAWAGSYTLTVAGATTVPIAATSSAAVVQSALAALPEVDLDGDSTADVVVTGGPGGVFGGQHYEIAFTAPPPPGGYPRITGTNVNLVNPLGPSVVVQCVRCGDVYRPTEATPPPGGRPAVIIAHSGGFVLGAKDQESGDITGPRMERWAEELAERGYVAVPINYSLAQPDTLAAIFSCEWDAPSTPGTPCPTVLTGAARNVQYDIQAAVRWLRWTALPSSSGGLDNPFAIDPNRIAVLGESAGAVGALAALYRSDDPGTIGITSTSSSIAAAISIAGFTTDADQDAGEGPALLMAFTNDAAGELFGFDLYDENREVVARARLLGNEAELVSYCQRTPTGAPRHLPELVDPEFGDQVATSVDFLYRELIDPAAPQPGVDWVGNDTRTFSVTPGQQLRGGQRGLVGDFDGDSNDDIVWYGQGATCDTVWFGRSDHSFADPREVAAGAFAPALDIGGAYEPVVGDFDGDGRDDILWYDPTTPFDTRLSYGNADRTFQTIAVGSAPAGLTLASGDFDGDGRDDVVATYRPLGAAIIAFGSSVRGVLQIGWYSVLPGVGLAPYAADFDGDDVDDLIWYDDSSGAHITVWYGNADRTVSQLELGNLVGDLEVLTADFNGDNHSDLVLYHPPSGLSAGFRGTPTRGAFVWYLMEAVGSWPRQAVGDFDGDGRADLLWAAPSSGLTWYGEPSSSPNAVSTSATGGVGADRVPLTGDFDGDGHTDIHWAEVTD